MCILAPYHTNDFVQYCYIFFVIYSNWSNYTNHSLVVFHNDFGINTRNNRVFILYKCVVNFIFFQNFSI